MTDTGGAVEGPSQTEGVRRYQGTESRTGQFTELMGTAIANARAYGAMARGRLFRSDENDCTSRTARPIDDLGSGPISRATSASAKSSVRVAISVRSPTTVPVPSSATPLRRAQSARLGRVRSRLQAVVWAYQNGIVDVGR